jgi:hypothetical protein
MIDLSIVRKRITVIWLCTAAILFLFFITLVGFNNDLANAAGSWYSTSIMPATGLIIGLWLAVTRTSTKAELVHSTSATLAQAFVYFYIICLIFPLIIFVGFVGIAFEDYFELSQMWLAILQTPTLAFLSKIFTEKTG